MRKNDFRSELAETRKTILPSPVAQPKGHRYNKDVYDRNPFVLSKQTTIVAKRKTSTVAVGSRVTIEPQSGGDKVEGQTTIAQVQEVDSARFVKIFAAEMMIALDLSKNGSRLFWCLIHMLQKNPNEHHLFFGINAVNETLEELGLDSVSASNFSKGLAELVKANILAFSTFGAGWVYYNIHLMFNGSSRLTIFREYIRNDEVKSPSEEAEMQEAEARSLSGLSPGKRSLLNAPQTDLFPNLKYIAEDPLAE